jgi:hypothetical protein
MSCPAFAASAALQAIKDVGQSVVAHPVHKVEIDARVSKRAAKSKDQCEFLGGEVVAVFQERRWKVVSRLVSKCSVGHRLFSEPLQYVDSNRTVLGRYHRNIVLTWRCYCLNDRDCTSPATEAALVDRGGASMTKRLT